MIVFGCFGCVLVEYFVWEKKLGDLN